MVDSRFFLKSKELTLDSLSLLLGDQLVETRASPQQKSQLVGHISDSRTAQAQDLVFLWKAPATEPIEINASSFAVTSPPLLPRLPQGMAALVVKDPQKALVRVAHALYVPAYEDEFFSREKAPTFPGCKIHDDASIHPTAQLAPGCVIHKGVVIHGGVTLGEGCVVHPYAVLSHTVAGKSVNIGAHSVIGKAGFGFIPSAEGPLDLPHLGRVLIQDDVGVGAQVCIDRGLLTDTILGKGCRIDNLVQIAHNVQLGRACVIVAQTGIAGSTRVGDFTMMGGQVGIADHITIGSGVKIAAQSGVMRDIPDGQIVGGSPAIPIKNWHRQSLLLERLIKNKTP